MNKRATITVILAGDHSLVREGIACLLRSKQEISVVGECSDGVAASELIVSMRPEIAIVDLEMPKLVEVIGKVRRSKCPTKIIVLSLSRDRSTVEKAFRNGTNGYVLKDGPSCHLFDAINCILNGGEYLTPLLSRVRSDWRDREPGNALDSLTPQEQVVFGFLVDGVRSKTIAALMDISPKTVDTYRSNIMRKLGLAGIAGLVKFAIERNLTLK